MSNRTWITAIYAVGLAIGVASPLLADPTSDARRAIQAQCDRSNGATARKDVVAAAAIYTADYTNLNKQGKVENLDLIKTQMQMVLAAMKSIKVTTTIQSIKLMGDTATVRKTDHAIVTIANPKTNKVSKMVIDEVDETTWVKRGSKWLEKHAAWKSDKGTIDGKPLPNM